MKRAYIWRISISQAGLGFSHSDRAMLRAHAPGGSNFF